MGFDCMDMDGPNCAVIYLLIAPAIRGAILDFVEFPHIVAVSILLSVLIGSQGCYGLSDWLKAANMVAFDNGAEFQCPGISTPGVGNSSDNEATQRSDYASIRWIPTVTYDDSLFSRKLLYGVHPNLTFSTS